METTNDLPALPPSVSARDLHGDTEVYTADMLRECILADRKASTGHATAVPVPEKAPTIDEKDARLGRYVKEFATKGGWDPDDGEGAFEFVQRHSYVVGIEDAGGTVGPFGTQTNGSRWPVSAFATASAPELTVWEGPMPESNGESNFTAVLMRKASMWDGPHVTIERSEYPDRIRYEADRVRHLIGEIPDEPDILAYDANKHSGYVSRIDQKNREQK